jgi:hypothetical protein
MTLVTQAAPISTSNGVVNPTWLCLSDSGEQKARRLASSTPLSKRIVNNTGIAFYNLGGITNKLTKYGEIFQILFPLK